MKSSETHDGITFVSILDFPPGTFFSLVSRSYTPIADEKFLTRTQVADNQIFNNPSTIGRCVTVSCSHGEPIGTISYDPRPFPQAVVGQNCMIPEHRSKGLGRLQLRHLIDFLKSKGFKEATVTTTDAPFYEPAQRMYEACGFTEVRRRQEGEERLIDYMMPL